MKNLNQQFEQDAKKGIEITDDDLFKISKLAKTQIEKEREIEKQTEYLKQLQNDLKVIREDQLPDLMMALGLKEFKLITGERVTIKEAIFTSITEANKPAAFTWLRKKKFGDIIKNDITVKLTGGEDKKVAMVLKFFAKEKTLRDLAVVNKSSVHAGTLKALVKEQRKIGTEFPECFSIFELKTSVIK